MSTIVGWQIADDTLLMLTDKNLTTLQTKGSKKVQRFTFDFEKKSIGIVQKKSFMLFHKHLEKTIENAV